MESGRSNFLVGLIALIFFVISLLTNIIGAILPDVIRSFQLSDTLAAFLPFSFFFAYAVMSIPTGSVLEKWGEKPILLGAFTLALAGSVLFSLMPQYRYALASLFLIGLGMAALQVAINPLLRVAGGEEHFAFNSVMAQLVFGLASFLSPYIYSHYATSIGPGATAGADPLVPLLTRLIPAGMNWVSMYWFFSIVTLIMLAILAPIRFPRVELRDDERTGALDTYLELLKQPVVRLYFVGIFCYVGTEQGLSDWMSEFLHQVHGYDPQTLGASTVAWFWGLMTVGAGVGLVFLKFFDSRRVLLGFGALAFVVLTVALFGPQSTAPWAFSAMGFAISVMWSIVFSLALNSLDKNHGTFSGILCTGIVGGALVPLFIGWLGDKIGLRMGLCVVYLTLGYVVSMGIWARPLITNKTVGGDSPT